HLFLQYVTNLATVTGCEKIGHVGDRSTRPIEIWKYPFGQALQGLSVETRHNRQERWNVKEHGKRPVLDMGRQCQLPLFYKLINGGLLRRLQDTVVNAVLFCTRNDGRIKRIEDQFSVRINQFVVRTKGSLLNPISVIKKDT